MGCAVSHKVHIVLPTLMRVAGDREGKGAPFGRRVLAIARAAPSDSSCWLEGPPGPCITRAPLGTDRPARGIRPHSCDAAEAVGCYSANEIPGFVLAKVVYLRMNHFRQNNGLKDPEVWTLFHFSGSPPSPAAPWPGAARNHSAATRLSLGAYTWMVYGVLGW